MIIFLIDHIFDEIITRLFQQISAFYWKQIVHLSLPTLFTFFYESDFLQTFARRENYEVRSSNLTSRHFIDNLTSNNLKPDAINIFFRNSNCLNTIPCFLFVQPLLFMLFSPCLLISF